METQLLLQLQNFGNQIILHKVEPLKMPPICSRPPAWVQLLLCTNMFNNAKSGQHSAVVPVVEAGEVQRGVIWWLVEWVKRTQFYLCVLIARLRVLVQAHKKICSTAVAALWRVKHTRERARERKRERERQHVTPLRVQSDTLQINPAACEPGAPWHTGSDSSLGD